MTVTPAGGQSVLNMTGILDDPYAAPPFKSHGDLTLTRRICEGRYTTKFATTTVNGEPRSVSYAAVFAAGRIDGRRAKCPLAGLPSSDIASVSGGLKLVCDGFTIVSLTAVPKRTGFRPGGLFSTMAVSPLLYHLVDLPAAATLLTIRVKYRHRRQRKVTLRLCFTPGKKSLPCH